MVRHSVKISAPYRSFTYILTYLLTENEIKYVCAAIALQEPSRLLQHLLCFILLYVKPDLQ